MTAPLLPVRFSNLKWLAKSPAHYAWNLAHPMKQTKAMRYGDALDGLLFKTRDVLTLDGATRRSKAYDKFAEDHPEAVLLTAPQQDIVLGMLAAVQGNKEAMDLLSGLPGKMQKTIKWCFNDRECSGTPDVFDLVRVVELKSTRNANPDFFPWDARKMAYHAQLAWYTEGLSRSGHVEPQQRFIVAVESTAPYPVTIFKLTDRAFDEGTKLWRLWFERLLVCEQSDTWPGYCAATVPFDTPDMDHLVLKIEGENVEVE